MTVVVFDERKEAEILPREAVARVPWQRPKFAVLDIIETEFGGTPGFDGCFELS